MADVFGVLSQPFGIGHAMRQGWRLYWSALPSVLPLALLFGIPGGLFTRLLESQSDDGLGSFRWTMFYEGTAGILCISTWLALMVGIAEGKRTGLTGTLRQGASAWPRVFAANFRAGLEILLYSLALIIPGIVRSITLGLVAESAFREPRRNALENSARLVTGRRWDLFWLTVLSNLPVLFLSLVMGFIGGMLQEMAPSASTVVSVVSDMVTRGLQAFGTAVSLCAYYGFKNLHGEQLDTAE